MVAPRRPWPHIAPRPVAGLQHRLDIRLGVRHDLRSCPETGKSEEFRPPLAGYTLPPCQAPRPLTEFVGRVAELDQLTRTLQPGAETAITGLVGMGGVGKAELAKLAAWGWSDSRGEKSPAGASSRTAHSVNRVPGIRLICISEEVP